MNSSYFNFSSKTLRKLLIFLLLISLGILGNYIGIPIYIEIDYLFGSIFLIILLHFFGLKYGLASAIFACVHLYFFWKEPYISLVFILEILFIGVVSKRINKSITLIDALYWIIIGAPFTALIYYFIIDWTGLELIIMIAKFALNGICNAFCAKLIIIYSPIDSFLSGAKKLRTVPINKAIFALVVGSVIISNTIINMANTNNYLLKVEEGINRETKSLMNVSVYNINSWYNQYLNGLSVLAGRVSYTDMTYSNELQQYTSLVHSSLTGLYSLYIIDSKGDAILASPMVDEVGDSVIGKNISSKEYFNEIKNTGKVVISDVFSASKNYFVPAVAVSVPIIKDSKIVGAVIGVINLNYIPVSTRLNNRDTHDNITIIIANEKDRIIASTNSSFISMDKLSLNDALVVDSSSHINLRNNKKWPKTVIHQETLYIDQVKIGSQLPWKVIMEVPLDLYKEGLQEYYLESLYITLLVILAAFFINTILVKLLTYPIFQLAEVTTHLPTKIVGGQQIEWPRSLIREIDSLINNFKSTSKILKDNFYEIQNANLELKYLAVHDPLTKLPNRMLFNIELNNAIITAKAASEKLAVMFLDLDRFKNINDTLGHNVGDKLLKEVARRLSDTLTENEKVFRIGGDEFTILVPNISSVDQISKAASKVLGIFGLPFLLNGQEFTVTTSIGISTFPEDGLQGEIILTNADIAMYRAKEKGKNNYQFYNVEMNTISLECLKIENNLRKALGNDEFLLYYQPRVDIKTGKISGMEALIRWNSSELGFVTPNRFIPIAEETGLIVPIGEWVIRTACAQNKLWQDLGLPPMRVSVNLSALQFEQHDLLEKIQGILEETKLDPEWLEIEITEGTAIKNIGFTISMLERLQNMGIKVSLDDFGTGFSSLNYLKNFKIDTLKIDASFVRDISEDTKNTAIINTIITLGKSLGLNVTGEGVETKEQLEFLKIYGCDEIQGYIFSKPLPFNEFQEYLENSKQ